MKQRRFPVVPVSILVILVGGAVVTNLKPFDAQPQAPEDPKEIVGSAREESSTKKIADIAKSQTRDRGKVTPEGEAESTEPALLLPAAVDYKPTINPTSTAAQWYKGKPRSSN